MSVSFTNRFALSLKKIIKPCCVLLLSTTLTLISFQNIHAESNLESALADLRQFLSQAQALHLIGKQAFAVPSQPAAAIPSQKPPSPGTAVPLPGQVILGNEQILTDYASLINGKKLGLITNQTGVDGQLKTTAAKLKAYDKATLIALYSPEHGLDGTVAAGKYVTSYTDANLQLPVYSLYGETREPSPAMLQGIDVLLFDIQDIGSRTYTYMSTMQYAMKAAAKAGIPFIVLDRPNPLGAIVEGYVAQDGFLTFVGVDNLPLAHGMTAGELAGFFNRKIGVALTVVPMKNYTHAMIWQDTGLPFVATSPNIPDVAAAFNYMAAGMGEGTGMGQADKFSWVGALKLNSQELARRLNAYGLPGLRFIPEDKGEKGGVRLEITDYRTYNPAKTGIYILATANQMQPLNNAAGSGNNNTMSDKLWGSRRFSQAMTQQWTPEQIINSYQTELTAFKNLRQNYLLYP